MRKVVSFLVVSADGYYAGPNDEFDWPNVDDQFNEFAIRQMDSIDTLLFGRVTYTFMAGYWPSEQAQRDDPVVAGRMNSIAKVVFSKTLDKADWSNSTLVTGDVAEELAKLKSEPGSDLALFGSPTFTTSLLELGLLDELRIMVHPVVLGNGKSIFKGLKERASLRLAQTTTFANGNVMLHYEPVNRQAK